MAFCSAHESDRFRADLFTQHDSDDNDSDTDTDFGSDTPPSPPSRSRSSSLSPSTEMDEGVFPGANEPVESPSALATEVKQVLAQMSSLGLTLPKFLHAISWGDAYCVRDPQIRGARLALMSSSLGYQSRAG